MLELIGIWIALLVALVVFAIGKPREGGALTLAYFLGLSLIHVPGCLAYLSAAPGSTVYENTRVGFEVTLMGMAAFVAGAFVVRAWFRGAVAKRSGALQIELFKRLSLRLIATGFVSYLILAPIAGYVPSLSVGISSMVTMLILGLWLRFDSAYQSNNQRQIIETLALLPLLPLTTLVANGFIGYGTNWLIGTVTYLYVIERRRFWFYMAAPVIAYLGLSLFVTYSAQRDEIRDVVWIQHASLSDRFDRTLKLITDFQFLDLNSSQHAEALGGRLNQNILVGAGVWRYSDGLSKLSYGNTVPLWILIPRAIWPDKPEIGGSGNLVSEFTGILFAQGTSVGVGQVLEFYMNFGVPGVIVGFLAFGSFLMWLDRNIMKAISTGDTRAIMLNALPGLSLLQPGGSLTEILVAAVAAFLLAHILLYFRVFNAISLRKMTTDGSISAPGHASAKGKMRTWNVN